MFQLHGIDPAPLAPLFDLSDAQLQARGMARRRVDAAPGFPCRASLEDAAVGEEVLLLPWTHHEVDSPYRASGPIYLRRGARRAQLPPGVVPELVASRLISLRAYDASGWMACADVVEGVAVGARLEQLFTDPRVAYVHLHNARPGCFSCLATRAG